MRPSGTFSKGGRRAAAILVAAAALAVVSGPAPAWAKVFLTQEEALKLAFPGEPDPVRRTAFLTDEQAARVETLSGEKPPTRVVTYYEGRAGTAYFDTHLVRTLPETVMVVVTPAGAIGRIDILSFNEPEEYLPRPRWMAQLPGRSLDEDLSLKKGVHPLTGATLSARALVACSRRVLALHRVIQTPPEKTPGAPHP